MRCSNVANVRLIKISLTHLWSHFDQESYPDPVSTHRLDLGDEDKQKERAEQVEVLGLPLLGLVQNDAYSLEALDLFLSANLLKS